MKSTGASPQLARCVGRITWLPFKMDVSLNGAAAGAANTDRHFPGALQTKQGGPGI